MCVCIGYYIVCMFVLQHGRMAVAEYYNYKSNQIKSNQRASKISDWLVLKNRWADLFQLWAVDSTELERAWSVI